MKTTLPTFDFRRQYLHHYSINNYLDSLQRKYPELVTVNVIGLSYEGREIKSIKISTTSKSTSQKKALALRRSANVRKTSINQMLRPTTHVSKSQKSTSINAKAIVLIDGGIHAREWCTISTALYCISQLTEDSESNKHLLDAFDFVIIPVVNVDGYEYSRTCVIINSIKISHCFPFLSDSIV